MFATTNWAVVNSKHILSEEGISQDTKQTWEQRNGNKNSQRSKFTGLFEED